MKVALLVALVVIAACSGAPARTSPATPAAKFSMKSYFLVLLHVGPAWTAEQTPESKQLFEGHMANIKAMGKVGKLVLAGPTEDDPATPNAIAGIFVLDVATKAEVEELLSHDPAIAAQRFVPQILPWYGAAGITYPGKEGP